MKKRVIAVLILVVYIAILIKVMVFKDLPLVRIGHIMLNFGGTDAGHAPNFVPFTTIVPYLLGYKGLVIAGINLVGNIILLVPVGFLIPFIYPSVTWKKSLALAAAASFAIELMQVVLRVGIFDIDDVILNALGVVIGYWIFLIFAKMTASPKYKKVAIAAIVGIVAVSFYVVAINPKIRLLASPTAQRPTERLDTSANTDLCGGTGGNGQIVSVGNNTFTIERNDSGTQIINLADQATIETSSGPASASDLKTGDRVTLVGGPNSDGSFTAEAVFVCNAPGPETRSGQ